VPEAPPPQPLERPTNKAYSREEALRGPADEPDTREAEADEYEKAVNGEPKNDTYTHPPGPERCVPDQSQAHIGYGPAEAASRSRHVNRPRLFFFSGPSP